MSIELVALGNDVAAAEAAAQATDGVLYASVHDAAEHGAAEHSAAEHSATEHRGTTDNAGGQRPFRTLVRAVTDNIDLLLPAAELGLYVAFSRVIRTRPTPAGASSAGASSPGTSSPGVTAMFPLIHNPELTHVQADTHWRDTHAPLALKHHPGMNDYTQLSVVATLAGPHYDGIALVAFASEQDLRTRFFGDENDIKAITEDVAKFADTQRSPKRVIATEHIYGQRPPMAKTP